MRRRVIATAALCALAAPATASAQSSCTVPKGWSTAAAQVDYELNREVGLSIARVQRHVPPPGSTVDVAAYVRNLPTNATNIAIGTFESGLYATAAVVTFGYNVALATVNEPPSCTTAKR